MLLHGGSILERDGDKLYNTAVLFGAEGDLRATYRKIHRFGFDAGEARAARRPGDEFLTLRGGPVPMGIATCYDLRFPELFRKLAEAGAEMFVVTASWPAAAGSTGRCSLGPARWRTWPTSSPRGVRDAGRGGTGRALGGGRPVGRDPRRGGRPSRRCWTSRSTREGREVRAAFPACGPRLHRRCRDRAGRRRS